MLPCPVCLTACRAARCPLCDTINKIVCPQCHWSIKLPALMLEVFQRLRPSTAARILKQIATERLNKGD